MAAAAAAVVVVVGNLNLTTNNQQPTTNNSQTNKQQNTGTQNKQQNNKTTRQNRRHTRHPCTHTHTPTHLDHTLRRHHSRAGCTGRLHLHRRLRLPPTCLSLPCKDHRCDASRGTACATGRCTALRRHRSSRRRPAGRLGSHLRSDGDPRTQASRAHTCSGCASRAAGRGSWHSGGVQRTRSLLLGSTAKAHPRW
jgi:hypothetical protein